MQLSDKSSIVEPQIKPTPKRFFILFMFAILAAIKSFQWIFFASITNLVANFYNVDNIMVNWSTVVFMITYLTLALPATWLGERIGLRNAVMIGAIGTSIGLIIKCFSCHRDGFDLAFLGNVIIGIVEPFYFSTYSRLASVWFPDDEVSKATSAGVIGDMLGMALAFIIPVMVVGEDPDDLGRIRSGLFYLYIANTLICSLNTVMIMFFFEDQPKYAPGVARYKQIKHERSIEATGYTLKHFLGTLIRFLKNADFNLMHTNYGINIGTGYAIHTVLNQIITGTGDQLTYSTSVVGRAGLILLLTGVVGSITCGYVLDKWRAYKSTAVLLYVFTLISLAIFTLVLKFNEPILIYLAIAVLGFCLSGYELSGFDYAVELTYPEPEQISSTILNMSSQIYGILITFATSILVDSYGSTTGCWFLWASFAVGLLVTLATGSNYKRLAAATVEAKIQLEQLNRVATNCAIPMK